MSETVLAFPEPIRKPESTWVTVTPETAARWLQANTKNRRLRQADVNRYARDMATNNWLLTGESVKFATDGTLLDGQHRLAAIVKAGVTIALLVVRNVPTDAQGVMDTGRKRTASDALDIAEHKHTSTLAAVAKLALGVEAGVAEPGRFEASHSEITSWVDANPDVEVAVDIARAFARRADCPPAVVAYTFLVLSRVDQSAAVDFWTAASEKVGLTAGDPVIALTNRFAESRRNREALSKRIYLSLIYRAWNARRAGKTMRFIRVNSPAGGLVPIPEPR